MPQITALRRMPYGRKVMEPGETFEASDKDAALLIKTRRAEAAGAKGPTDLPETVMARASKVEPLADNDGPQTYRTRHMEAESTQKKPRGRPRGSGRLSQSSHPDQASEGSTSPSSGDDAA